MANRFWVVEMILRSFRSFGGLLVALTLISTQAWGAVDQALLGSLIQEAESQGEVRVIVGLTPAGDATSGGGAESQAAGPTGPGGGAGRSGQAPGQAIATAQLSLLRALRGKRVSGVKRFAYIPYIAMSATPQVLRMLARDPAVRSIHRDEVIPPALESSNGVIGTPNIARLGYTGTGTVVAVLDSGVDKYHAYFDSGTANKVVSEACYSTTYVPDLATTLCVDGADPTGADSSTAPDSGLNCPLSIPLCWHGTHVAGIVAGNDTLTPGQTDFGVARDAGLVAIQVFSRFGAASPYSLGAYLSDLIRGLERVYALRTVDNVNIVAVNMSLGGGAFSAYCDTSPLKSVIDMLHTGNVATVVATGNNGYRTQVAHPGCISTAVAVGATDNSDVVASFSNIAAIVDLLAPGVNVRSAYAQGAPLEIQASGTSMATPHVAGAWAALREADASITVDEALALFKLTGTSVDDTRSSGVVVGMKRINLDRAIAVRKGDLDHDLDVDTADYNLFVAAFGTSTGNPAFNPEADYDASGRIDFFDYQYFYNFHWIAQQP